MPEFTCSVCGEPFEIPDSALKKYPGWTPRYCRAHSPAKKTPAKGASRASSSGRKKKKGGGSHSGTGELNLTLDEVLARFSEGPDTGVFTDGGARPNPGPGGWGFVHVADGEVIHQDHGHDGDTTNNRMELTALIRAYERLDPDADIDIYSDSNLCVQTINQWAASWERNGWKRKTGPIKNLDLVKQLYALSKERPNVRLQWIKAHCGWLWNEYADSLATAWTRGVL